MTFEYKLRKLPVIMKVCTCKAFEVLLLQILFFSVLHLTIKCKLPVVQEDMDISVTVPELVSIIASAGFCIWCGFCHIEGYQRAHV
jgi:hypothetical protein